MHNKRQIPSPCQLISACKSPARYGGQIRACIFTSPCSYRLAQRRRDPGDEKRPRLLPASLSPTRGWRLPSGGGREGGAGAARALCAFTRLAAYLRRKDGTSRIRGPAGAGGADRRCASGRLRYQHGPGGGRSRHGGCEGVGLGRRGPGSPGRPRPACGEAPPPRRPLGEKAAAAPDLRLCLSR